MIIRICRVRSMFRYRDPEEGFPELAHEAMKLLLLNELDKIGQIIHMTTQTGLPGMTILTTILTSLTKLFSLFV
jgi:hypothetical protein